MAAGVTWRRGVQFRSTQADRPNVWPPALYEFELLAWVDCRPAESRANVSARFSAEVDPQTHFEMARWRAASAAEWTALAASDRALGFPLVLTSVVTGAQLGT